jgi:protein tyrosine phosphatase
MPRVAAENHFFGGVSAAELPPHLLLSGIPGNAEEHVTIAIEEGEQSLSWTDLQLETATPNTTKPNLFDVAHVAAAEHFFGAEADDSAAGTSKQITGIIGPNTPPTLNNVWTESPATKPAAVGVRARKNDHFFGAEADDSGPAIPTHCGIGRNTATVNVEYDDAIPRNVIGGASTFAPPSRRTQAWPAPFVGQAPPTTLQHGSYTTSAPVQGRGVAALIQSSHSRVGELPAYEQALLALETHGGHGMDPIDMEETEPPMSRVAVEEHVFVGGSPATIAGAKPGTGEHTAQLKAAYRRLRQGIDDAIACEDPSREFAGLAARSRTFKYDTVRAKHPQNRNRNRYQDILPHEATRVLLQGTKDANGAAFMSATSRADDYINANIVTLHVPPGRIQRTFIMSQGPLENTVFDFWQMVYEQKCGTIVMLTAEVEQERIKCFGYWPAAVKRKLDDGKLRIECVGITVLQQYVTTRIQITDLATRNLIEVKHIRYREWPEHGVPAVGREYAAFLDSVDRIVSPTQKMLVHCSSGAGRTGVFVTAFMARATFHNLAKWDGARLAKITPESLEDIFSMTDTVRLLRDVRCPLMVRTKAQYAFCFRAVAVMLQGLAAEDGAITAPITQTEGRSFFEIGADDEMWDGDRGEIDRAMDSVAMGSTEINASKPTVVAEVAVAAQTPPEVHVLIEDYPSPPVETNEIMLTLADNDNNAEAAATDGTGIAGGEAERFYGKGDDDGAVSEGVAARRKEREDRRQRLQSLKERAHERQASPTNKELASAALINERTATDAAPANENATKPVSISRQGSPELVAPDGIGTDEPELVIEEGIMERLFNLTKRLAFGETDANADPSASKAALEVEKDREMWEDPLPNGWVRRTDPKTTRVFYANLITKETTWIDPRAPSTTEIPTDYEEVDWNELPPGYERVVNVVGDLYYINHNNHTTNWFPPRDLRQAARVDELDAAARKAHLCAKQVEGGLNAVRHENLVRQSRLKILKLQADEAKKMSEQANQIGKEALSEESRAKYAGKYEVLRDQVGSESEAITLQGVEVAATVPVIERYLEKTKAIEQVAEEFAMQVFDEAQTKRSRLLAAKQVALTRELHNLRKTSLVDLSSLTDAWKKTCTEGGKAIATFDVAIAAPTPDPSEMQLHIDENGSLKTDCGMKMTCLVIEYVVFKKIAELRNEMADMMVRTPAGHAESSALSVEVLQTFENRLKEVCIVPATFMECVAALLGSPPRSPGGMLQPDTAETVESSRDQELRSEEIAREKVPEPGGEVPEPGKKVPELVPPPPATPPVLSLPPTAHVTPPIRASNNTQASLNTPGKTRTKLTAL